MENSILEADLHGQECEPRTDPDGIATPVARDAPVAETIEVEQPNVERTPITYEDMLMEND